VQIFVLALLEEKLKLRNMNNDWLHIQTTAIAFAQCCIIWDILSRVQIRTFLISDPGSGSINFFILDTT
jgi:hypothetical protein